MAAPKQNTKASAYTSIKVNSVLGVFAELSSFLYIYSDAVKSLSPGKKARGA